MLKTSQLFVDLLLHIQLPVIKWLTRPAGTALLVGASPLAQALGVIPGQVHTGSSQTVSLSFPLARTNEKQVLEITSVLPGQLLSGWSTGLHTGLLDSISSQGQVPGLQVCPCPVWAHLGATNWCLCHINVFLLPSPSTLSRNK